MSPKAHDMDDLLILDFDEVVDRARSLSARNRSAALSDALSALQVHMDLPQRVKLLLFVQTLLASTADRRLKSPLIEQSAIELTKVLTSRSEAVEVKRSALDAIALLLVKANDLTADIAAKLREAIAAAANSSDPEMSSFAHRILDKPIPARRAKASKLRPKILLIHGREDELNVLHLMDFMRKQWGASVVVVNDVPAPGRTIIEKFEEAASGASFAIALITPNDIGAVNHPPGRIARWNVAFELGWAYGRLGPSHVLMLVKEGVHLPSDLEAFPRIDFVENVLDVSAQLQTELESASMLPEMLETA